MNEKNRQRVVFACLGLAILWGASNFGSSETNEVESKQKTIQPLSASATTRTNDALIDVEAYELTDWGQDPFKHYRKKKHVSSVTMSWNLSGIVYSDDRPIAVINNKTVRVGDKIGQARVLRIEKDRVMIEHHGSPVTLTVTKG